MIEAYDDRPTTQRAALVLLFVTLDPERDDAAALRDDTDLFHPALIGLTGKRAEIVAAARAFRIPQARQAEGRDPGAHLLDHAAITHLLDPAGGMRRLFPPTATVGEMSAALRPPLASTGDGAPT